MKLSFRNSVVAALFFTKVIHPIPAVEPRSSRVAPAGEVLGLGQVGALLLPKLNFTGSLISEMADFLQMKAKSLDPQGVGLTFLMDEATWKLPDRVSIDLRDVTFADAIRYISLVARMEVSVVDGAVQWKRSASVHPPFKASKATPRVQKASAIVFPKFAFKEATAEEALGFLRQKLPTLDSVNGNVPVLLDPDLTGNQQPRVTLELQNAPLSKVLISIAKLINAEVISLGDAFYIQPPKARNAPAGELPREKPVAAVTPRVADSFPNLGRLYPLVLPRITFTDTTISDAVDFLQQKVKTLAPQDAGLTFLVDDATRKLPVGLTITAYNCAVGDLIRYIALQARLEVAVVDGAVHLKPSAASHPPYQGGKPTPRIERCSALVFPKINFTDSTLGEAVDFLAQKSKTLDPDGIGAPIIVDPELADTKGPRVDDPRIKSMAPGIPVLPPEPPADPPASLRPRITFTVAEAPLSRILNFMARLADAEVVCLGDAYYIQPLKPRGAQATALPRPKSASVVAPPVVPFPNLGRLHTLVFPKINFTEATLTDALDFLQRKSKLLDPQETGLTFLVDEAARKLPIRITLTLADASIGDIIQYIAVMALLEVTAVDGAVRLKHSKATRYSLGPDEPRQPTPRLERCSALVFPKINFTNSTLREAADYLVLKSKTLDPEGVGLRINLVRADLDLAGKALRLDEPKIKPIRPDVPGIPRLPSEVPGVPPADAIPRITLTTEGATLAKILHFMAILADAEVICVGDSYCIKWHGP